MTAGTMGSTDPRQRIASDYLRPLFVFALRRTSGVEEAEDLLGEIVLQLYSSLRGDPEIRNLDAWVWRVATYTWRRHLSRANGSREIIGLAVDPMDLSAGPEEALLREEQVSLLRREVAALSRTHRELIVGRYFDGHSIRELSRRTGVPAGTVKWHLFEARQTIRKGVGSMVEYGERSFRPEQLNVGFCGQLGEEINPCMLINTRRIPQNIALACYEHPVSVSGLSSELGIGRPYLEDEVALMARSELLVSEGKELYRTNFIIPDAALIEERLSMQYQASTSIVPALRSFFLDRRQELETFGTACGLGYDLMLWTLIPFALSDPRTLGTRPTFEGLPVRPDGGRWVLMAQHRTARHRAVFSNYRLLNLNGPMISSDGHGMTWAVEMDWTGFGTFRDWLVRSGRLSHHVIDHLIERDMQLASVEQGFQERVAKLLEHGILAKCDGAATCRVLWLGHDQMTALRGILENLRGELGSSDLRPLTERIETLYRNHVPAHLHDQVSSVVAASSYDVALFAIAQLVEERFLSRPKEEEKGRICILMQGRKPLPIKE